MSDTEWIDDLVSEIAKKYRIVLSHDDPVLVTAILNKEVMAKAQDEFQSLFVKNSQLLQQQLKNQKKTNELLLTEVTDRLIQSSRQFQVAQGMSRQQVEILPKRKFENLPLMLLVFMFGLVGGIVIAKLI